jgi:predicted peptidase
MLQKILVLNAAAALLALPACTTTKPAAGTPPAPQQMAKQFTFEKTQTVRLKYLFYLPRGYQAGSAKRWPLILFLHGSGERGNNVWKVATHGPPKVVTNRSDFPFILVSPQCPDGKHWERDSLLALLDDVIGRNNVDTNRVYLTGLSMGGYGTWELGLSSPEKFAAIAPICGGGEFISLLLSSREKTKSLKTLGIWAFHGAKDPVVPLSESERMVEAAKKAGVKEVKLTVYPEAGHDSWTETYKSPELYEWLLKHDRGE